MALNVLVASDDVMIPVRPDDFSFAGLADLAEQVERVKALNPGLVLQGAFFTHWQKRETGSGHKRLCISVRPGPPVRPPCSLPGPFPALSANSKYQTPLSVTFLLVRIGQPQVLCHQLFVL